MSKIYQIWDDLKPQQRKLLKYFFTLFLIWISWKLIILVLGEQRVPINERAIPALSTKWEQFNTLLVAALMGNCQFVMEKLGYWVFIHDRTIWIDPMPGVTVGNYCLGLQLIYYFVLLILVTPMNSYWKFGGAIAAVAIVWMLNISRISGLVIVSYHLPEYLWLAHDHLFNIVVFAALIPLFVFLARHEK